MTGRRANVGRPPGAPGADMRWIALVVVLIALAVAGGFLTVSRLAQGLITAKSPGPDGTLQLDNWPICTSVAQMGSEVDWAQLDPDFAAGKNALVVGDWTEAITSLKLASMRDPKNADIQNYVGYAYYRLRRMGPAMHHYQEALTHNRRHRGAHEHLGELYLALGDPGKAEQQLAALEEICLIPCSEYASLERAIAIYKQQPTH